MTAATGAWAQSTHRITATAGYAPYVQSATMDVTLPFESTCKTLFEAIAKSSIFGSIKEAKVQSGNNITIEPSNDNNGWDTKVYVSAEGNAVVSLSIDAGGLIATMNININVETLPYTVSLKSGTKDADKWTVKVNNGSTQSLPTGVAMGDAVTLNYSGRLRVKKVTATTDAAKTPLTMEATSAGTIVVEKPRSGMQYSLNGGAKQTMSGDTYTIPESGSLSVGDKVAFYGDGTDITTYYPNINDYTRIYGGTATVKMYGNIMSLVDEDGFATAKVLTESDAFSYLFFGNDKLTDVSGLLLPATTLTERCYSAMFYSCTSLTSLPADLLPATTLANSCYNFMFFGCSNLTAAPELPAPTLADYCYWCMFSSCSKLASVTCLATNISASNCTTDWLKNVAATGTFTKAPAMTSWTTGNNGIPSGWTVEDAQ